MQGSLRIGVDMDGTLADLGSAYAEIEERLFGADAAAHEQPLPEAREVEQQIEATAEVPAGAEIPIGTAPITGGEVPTENAAAAGDARARGDAEKQRQRGRRKAARLQSGHRERVWRAIEATPDFWTTLKPIEDGAVERLYALAEEHKWEVFFITQRPATAGRTVQSQTYKWLVAQGYPTPSVIPLSGGRGKAAAALKLDYLVDDSPQNCVDVLVDSSTRAILLIRADDPVGESSARRLGVGVAHHVHEALDLLVRAAAARANPSLFEQLRKLVGWK